MFKHPHHQPITHPLRIIPSQVCPSGLVSEIQNASSPLHIISPPMSVKKHNLYYRGLCGLSMSKFGTHQPRLIATSSRESWKYEECVLDVRGVNGMWLMQRVVPVGEHVVRMRYDKELRGEVVKVMNEKLREEWESVDVVRFVETRDVEGWEEEGEGRVVVLISMAWPLVEGVRYTKHVERLQPEVQVRCQEAVNKIHELMCEHGMPDIHAEIKEGDVQMLEIPAPGDGPAGRVVGMGRYRSSPYKAMPLLGHHVRLQTTFDVELARVVWRDGRKTLKLTTGDGEDKWKSCGSVGGAVFAYVRIRGEGFAIVPGHAMPTVKGEKNKHPIVVCSNPHQIGSSIFGKLVCSFENEVEDVSGGLRNWALIKLDKERFGDSLPKNQLPHPEDATFKHNFSDALLSFNGVLLPCGTNAFRDLINSNPHFFNPASLTSPTFVADNDVSSTKACEYVEAGRRKDEPEVAVLSIDQKCEGKPLPKHTFLKVTKYAHATRWTAGALNHIASSIRVPGADGKKITVTCLSVLNYKGHGQNAKFCDRGDSGGMVQTVGTHTREGGEVVGMLLAGGGVADDGFHPWMCGVGYVVPVGETMEDVRRKLKLRDGETIDWC